MADVGGEEERDVARLRRHEDPRQIAEEVELMGATLHAGAGSDFTTLSASALSVFGDKPNAVLDCVRGVGNADFLSINLDLAFNAPAMRPKNCH